MANSDYNDISKEEFAAVHLLLQAIPTTVSPISLSPSDEELAAFMEHRLDITRKSQIIEMIANNEAVYERWMRCVENSDIIYKNRKSIQQSKKESNGLLAKLKDFSHINRLKVFGGGFVTAALALTIFTVLPLVEKQEKTVSELYDSLEPDIQLEWSKNTPAKKLKYAPSRSFFVKPKTIERKILETGFRNGANRLGKGKFAVFNLNIDTLTQAPIDFEKIMSKSNYQSLYSIGQLSALLSLRCALDPGSNGLIESGDVFKSLIITLETMKSENIQDVLPQLDKSASIQTQQCLYADAILHLLLK